MVATQKVVMLKAVERISTIRGKELFLICSRRLLPLLERRSYVLFLLRWCWRIDLTYIMWPDEVVTSVDRNLNHLFVLLDPENN